MYNLINELDWYYSIVLNLFIFMLFNNNITTHDKESLCIIKLSSFDSVTTYLVVIQFKTLLVEALVSLQPK